MTIPGSINRPPPKKKKHVFSMTLHLYAVQALVGAASSNCSDKGQCRAGNALMAVLIPTTSG